MGVNTLTLTGRACSFVVPHTITIDHEPQAGLGLVVANFGVRDLASSHIRRCVQDVTSDDADREQRLTLHVTSCADRDPKW